MASATGESARERLWRWGWGDEVRVLLVSNTPGIVPTFLELIERDGKRFGGGSESWAPGTRDGTYLDCLPSKAHEGGQSTLECVCSGKVFQGLLQATIIYTN